ARPAVGGRQPRVAWRAALPAGFAAALGGRAWRTAPYIPGVDLLAAVVADMRLLGTQGGEADGLSGDLSAFHGAAGLPGYFHGETAHVDGHAVERAAERYRRARGAPRNGVAFAGGRGFQP